jgi:hypothetical protein
MKNIINKTIFIFFLLFVIGNSMNVFSQGPPKPPLIHGIPGYYPNIPAGGTPLDGGLSIVLILGAAYGVKKSKCFKGK